MRSVMGKNGEHGIDPKLFPGANLKQFVTTTKTRGRYLAVHGMTGFATQGFLFGHVLCVRDGQMH
jgi:hypothetical protein